MKKAKIKSIIGKRGIRTEEKRQVKLFKKADYKLPKNKKQGRLF
jgi:hypothetical protein